jgi:hypothetical protein
MSITPKITIQPSSCFEGFVDLCFIASFMPFATQSTEIVRPWRNWRGIWSGNSKSAKYMAIPHKMAEFPDLFLSLPLLRTLNSELLDGTSKWGYNVLLLTMNPQSAIYQLAFPLSCGPTVRLSALGSDPTYVQNARQGFRPRSSFGLPASSFRLPASGFRFLSSGLTAFRRSRLPTGGRP